MSLNLCSSCLSKAHIVIKQPQLLKVVKWCDGCNKVKSSYNVVEATRQALKED